MRTPKNPLDFCELRLLVSFAILHLGLRLTHFFKKLVVYWKIHFGKKLIFNLSRKQFIKNFSQKNLFKFSL